MATQSLLGHLASRFAVHPENVATESLAYVLQRSPGAKRALLAFIRHLGVPVPENLSFRTQESGPDGSIPDLVGTDSDGRQVVIIEAKFWAGLTDNQPVAYLNRLPTESEAILLFIAPALRSTLLWTELLSRCKETNVPLGTEREISPEVKLRSIRQHHTLALSSWRALLTHLLQTLNVEGDTAAISDVLQLQGICDRMDDDAFLPLRSEELSSSIGARFIQFCGLVDDVANRLVANGLASVLGVKTSTGTGSYFRPMKIYGFGCYLQVNSEHWVRRRLTPVWLSVRDQDWKSARVVRDTLLSLQLEDPPRILDGNNELLVPMRLPVGVERPQVVDSLFHQVCEVADLLAQSGTASPETPNR